MPETASARLVRSSATFIRLSSTLSGLALKVSTRRSALDALTRSASVRAVAVGLSVSSLNTGSRAGFRFSFPTSLTSQAESRFLGLGPELRLARVFPVLDGLIVYYGFRYMKYLNRYTTLQRETNPYDCTRADLNCEAHGQLGDPARSHGFSNSILLQLDFLRELWRPMSFAVQVVFNNSLGYDLPEATVQLLGGREVPVDHIADPVNHRASIWYVFDVSLEITDYLSVSVGASTFSPQLRPDSTYRQPFFNRYTNIYVDLGLDIERLVSVFRR